MALTTQAATPAKAMKVRSDSARGFVRALHESERRVSPNGSGQVWFLSRGESVFVGRLELAGAAVVPQHSDATDEVIVVLEGSGEITIDGVSHRVATGATVFMPAGSLVSYSNGPAPMVAIQVFAGPAPAAKYDAWTAVEAS